MQTWSKLKLHFKVKYFLKRRPSCTSVHRAANCVCCAPVLTVTVSGKNSQESHCAQSCMDTELEAQSWRTHMHQFKYITIPNPFITHFGDRGWVPGQLRTHVLDLLSTS